ncbi:MAG: preprotein translocase subunit SecE [Nitrospiraceae bacterium]|nr:preprotein translocase subunit SecE [Nitrospiraceae bacterium]MDA8325751.1 preprotein translocase subunit SecE [Nitrospiraceae bacterium]
MQKLKQFLREVKVELKKVVFPTREELLGSTQVVIISVLIMSVFLGVIDLVLSRIVQALLRY